MVSKRKGELEENEDFRSTACGENIWFPSKSGNGTFRCQLCCRTGRIYCNRRNERFRKSTLLNLLGGLDVPTEGKISIRGHDIGSLTRKEQTIFRRRNIGFVFQNYSLMPVLNVYDNVALPVTFDKGSHVDREHIRELLNELGLWEKRKRYPSELSGGQQQRVAIARALANKPALLLADEPTGNLDSKTAVEVIGLLKASSQKYHQTVLMVTHNEVLAQTCDRIIRIEDGRLYQREDAFYGEGGEL